MFEIRQCNFLTYLTWKRGVSLCILFTQEFLMSSLVEISHVVQEKKTNERNTVGDQKNVHVRPCSYHFRNKRTKRILACLNWVLIHCCLTRLQLPFKEQKIIHLCTYTGQNEYLPVRHWKLIHRSPNGHPLSCSKNHCNINFEAHVAYWKLECIRVLLIIVCLLYILDYGGVERSNNKKKNNCSFGQTSKSFEQIS